jgi:hypothetical protein
MFQRSSEVYAMKRDMNKWGFESYNALPSTYTQLYELRKSKAAYEIEVSAIGMGKLVEKTESSPLIARNPMEGYPVYGKNRTFGDLIQMTYESVEDNQKVGDILKATSQTWGFTVPETLDNFYAKPYNYAGYTSGHDIFNATITGVCADPSGLFIYDGKPLVALSGNNHTSKGGGTYYNGTANTLTYGYLQDAYTLMASTNAFNEKDEKINITADTLLVPAALRFTGTELLNSEKQPWVSTNTASSVQNIVKLVVWNELTDTNAWFLLKAKMGMVAMDREAMAIDFWQDPTTKNFMASCQVRFGLLINNFRGTIGNGCEVS